MINGITKYSLIEGDLGNHQTEIDFGSVMKNLMFDQSLTRVYSQYKTNTWFLNKVDRPCCVLFTRCLTFNTKFKCQQITSAHVCMNLKLPVI